jgi:hypothetical protein
MKRVSGRLGVRRLIAVAGAGVLLSAGLGVAAASAADQTPKATGGTRATSVPMFPCALKYVSGSLYVGSDGVDKVSQQTGDATFIAPQLPNHSGWDSACGVAVDGPGNLLVADGPQVIVVAAKTGTFYGEKMVKGRAYLIVIGNLAGSADQDVQLDPSGNVVFDSGGELASTTNDEYDSQVFVLAQHTGTFYGKKMVKGKLYVIAGVLNGGSLPGGPCGGATADAPVAGTAPAAATKATQANLGYMIGTLRFDAAGNIILADSGGYGSSPCGADFYDVHPRVAVIPARTGNYYGQKMTAGDIYAIAGLGSRTANGVPAADSDLTDVAAVALDHAGNILVATSGNLGVGPVRVIAEKSGTRYGQKMIKGDIYTLPGLADAGAVAVDAAGNVLVGDQYDYLVRMLAEKTGGYYGVKARAGHVYTIAGNGQPPL